MEEQKEQTAKEPAAGAQPGFGKLLRSLREKAGLSLDDVANRTKISRGQLEAMEREEMPASSRNLSTSGPLSATSAA